MADLETNRIIVKGFIEQYGAAFKTLERIIDICPDEFWNDLTNGPEFYKILYHTMFFTDLYLSTEDESKNFTPKFSHAEDFRSSKENFHPKEWARSLSKSEVKDYLKDLRVKGRKRIEELTIEQLISNPLFKWHGSSLLSSLMYNLRHIMLHIGALQVRLRIHGVEERFWVSQSQI
ncbi:MAG: hypothetical protein ACXADY_16410 [Candidatus Hodarchaeales archaeon]